MPSAPQPWVSEYIARDDCVSCDCVCFRYEWAVASEWMVVASLLSNELIDEEMDVEDQVPPDEHIVAWDLTQVSVSALEGLFAEM